MSMYTRKVQGVAITATAAAGVALLMSGAFAQPPVLESFLVLASVDDAACTLDVPVLSVDFGIIAIDGAGLTTENQLFTAFNINVACTNALYANVTITLETANVDSDDEFNMVNDVGDLLPYLLWQDIAMTTLWLSGAPVTVPGVPTGTDFTVQGQIPIGTFVGSTGAYSDIVSVTVAF